MSADDRRFEAAEGLEGIAVIGMAGRLPGAPTLARFWENLRAGRESITFLSAEELAAAGVPASLAADPDYVPAVGVLEDDDRFDAAFFGFTPREAELLDPQHRLFLECAAQALDDAGYDPRRFAGRIALYGGAGANGYLLSNLLPNQALIEEVGRLQILLLGGGDTLCTRVSYKLDLRGPSVQVQTACSTSLAAVHLACQSLLTEECEMALAGGVSVGVPRAGYLYQPGGILAADGHCRAFDARATGSVGGSGVGLVVLKRLSDALADGDAVRAVIRASAMNNDGSTKVGFTAPSVRCQAEVIAEALALAGVEPAEVSYVEAHGSGTALGDGIEVEALSEVFGRHLAPGTCGIGSVKTNVGHLNAAAGIAGLLKTVLALEHREIPPSLNFEEPNPELALESRPFRVVRELTPWTANGGPRRAGVSSFGLGGTNVHAVVEEAPPREPSGASRPLQLLQLSARSPEALNTAAAELAAHLEAHPEVPLADAAFTLRVGRPLLRHRRALVAADAAEAAQALAAGKGAQGTAPDGSPRLTFLFPGLGDHYPGMTRGLYRDEPAFRREVDRGAEVLAGHLGVDVRELLFPGAPEEPRTAAEGSPDLRALLRRGGGEAAGAPRELDRTLYAQPALFLVEHALARLLLEWGLAPRAMLGYSLGEYVAATLSGVLSLEDALHMVAERARLIEGLPRGAMLAVPLPAEEVEGLLPPEIALAATNGPNMAVVGGPAAAVAALEQRLADEEVACLHLTTTHAFHTPMMDGAAEALTALARSLALGAPRIPYVSNVTGTWITPAEATDPAYWARHMRSPVRFAEGLAALFDDPDRVFCEAGPGGTLTTLVRQHPGAPPGAVAVPAVRHPSEPGSDLAFLLGAAGRLWTAGVGLDEAAFWTGERRHRVPLPPYPFEGRRYWIDPPGKGAGRVAPAAAPEASKAPDLADWFYAPGFRRTPPKAAEAVAPQAPEGWLLLLDEGGFGGRLARRLAADGHRVATLAPGDGFAAVEGGWTLDPGDPEGYSRALRSLGEGEGLPTRVLHLWGLCPDGPVPEGPGLSAEGFDRAQERGLVPLLYLARALAEAGGEAPVRLGVVAQGLLDVLGEEPVEPAVAPLLGACRVLHQELPRVTATALDVHLPAPGSPQEERLGELLVAEMRVEGSPAAVAFRGAERWEESFEPVRLPPVPSPPPRLREGGVYLVTDAGTEIGRVVAETLLRRVRARLVVGLPPRTAGGPGAEPGTVAGPGQGAPGGTAAATSPEETATALAALAAETGGEIVQVSADPAAPEGARALVEEATRRFGRLDGAVHTAVSFAGGLAQLKSAADLPGVFGAQGKGALHLLAALAGREPDFVLLSSSAVGVAGGLGQVDLAAASCLLDALAQHRAAAGGGFTAALDWGPFAWEEWALPGTMGEAGVEEALHESLARVGITAAEAEEAWLRALASPLSRVVISPRDLAGFIAATAEVTAETVLAEVSRHTEVHPRGDLSTPYAAPGNPTEEALVKIWGGLFGIEGIGAEDSFFELGGHSLLGIQLITQVRRAFDVDLPITELFEHPTIATQAARIEELRGGAAAPAAGPAKPPVPPFVRQPKAAYYPLSFDQERLWFIHELEPGASAYNIDGAMLLDGPLDHCAVRRAVAVTVRRHGVWRTTFPKLEGRPVQVVHPPGPFHLPVIDLGGVAGDLSEADLGRFALAEAHKPFDLETGPLVRMTLLRLGPRRHLFLSSVHHIVTDWFSFHVFWAELAALYPAFTGGRPAPALPELPIAFVDFVTWQRRAFAGANLEAYLGFWVEQLSEMPQVLELPTDHPRPLTYSSRGRKRRVYVEPRRAAALKALGGREGASVFMTLLALFSTLLSRISGQDRLLVASPNANRGAREVEPLIGFFLTQLVFACDLSGGPSFRQLLARLRTWSLAAFPWADLPFSKLVEALKPERDTSRPPLVQTNLLLLDAEYSQLELPGLDIRPLLIDDQAARYELSMAIWDTGEGALKGFLEYNVRLFDATTVERHVQCFEALIDAALANPDRPVGHLEMLPRALRHQVLLEAADTRRELPADPWVHRRFAARAEVVPEAVAVEAGERSVSYGELRRRAGAVARHLGELGVGPGTVVGLGLERSPELPAALLGVLESGAAYLPLETELPAVRRGAMLADAGAGLLLSCGPPPELPGDVGVRAVDLAVMLAGPFEEPPLPVPVTAESLAYTVYTSGSTGCPKGVAVPHRALANFVAEVEEALPLGPGRRALQQASVGFDAMVLEVFPPLVSGSRLVQAPPARLHDPGEMAALLRRSRVTALFGVPSLYRLLVEEEDFGRCPELADLVSGGEALPGSLARRLLEVTGARLHNTYGPTETTVYTTRLTLEPGAAGAGEPPLGRPIANTRLVAADRRLEPAPPGVPGELLVGGADLAWGYLGRPGLTAARFVPDPFAGVPGARLYRTGDLVRFRGGGDLEFLGRTDHQIKVRGIRMEPGEIEAALRRHPAVSAAVVTARKVGAGAGPAGLDGRLVAYVVGAPGAAGPPDAEALRAHLRDLLPASMVPAVFVPLEALPLTRQGKVDRRRLPEPEIEGSGGGGAAGSWVEERLAAVWRHVLGVEQVGSGDNFFSLGGDSILSIQMVSRAREAGIQLDPGLVFQHQTLAALAAAAGNGAAVVAEQGPVVGEVPLTPVQRAFFASRPPAPHHFNQALLFRVPADLRPGLLVQALRRLVVHHDALRLAFEQSEDGWRQVNRGPEALAADPPEVPVVELGALAEADRPQALGAAADRLQAGLNLGRGSLLRTALFRRGEEADARLLLLAHHLAVDGVSWRILLEDLESLYRQLGEGREPVLPPKTTSFKRWAELLAGAAVSPEVTGQVGTWETLLGAGPPPARLPADFPEAPDLEGDAERVTVALEPAETRALLALSGGSGAREILLGALGLALAGWTGERRWLVDVEAHGREPLFPGVDLSRTAGWFTAVFPVVLEVPPAGLEADAPGAAAAALGRAPGSGIGFGLLRWMGEGEPAGRLAALPEAEVSFNYLGQVETGGEAAAFRLADEPAGAARGADNPRPHRLAVDAVAAGGRLTASFTYGRRLFRRPTVEELAGRFLAELRGLVGEAEAAAAADLDDFGWSPSDLDAIQGAIGRSLGEG